VNKIKHMIIKTIPHMAVVCIALSVMETAQATPYRPTNDLAVVETLPAGSQTFQTRVVIKNLSKQPFAAVQPQISALLTQSYTQGDPRALGQAESLLEPYTHNPSYINDPAVLSLRANILQANHQFDESKKLLQQILIKIPNQPDSLLMLSSINLVQGNFAAARQGCDGIRDMGLMFLRLACMAQVDNMTGKIIASRATLEQLAQMNSGLTPEQSRWLNLILADIALRLDDSALANTVFKTLDTTTAPSLTARADWLLAHQQWAQVQQLLATHTDNDALLLRLVISEMQQKSPRAKADFQLLSERISVWQARGETAHQREEAMFAMLLNPSDKALDLARSNWQKQRETADVVIYTNAAIRAQSKPDLKIIQAWIKQTGFEYPRLTQQLAQSLRVG